MMDRLAKHERMISRRAEVAADIETAEEQWKMDCDSMFIAASLIEDGRVYLTAMSGDCRRPGRSTQCDIQPVDSRQI